jgi:peroxiredoxin family protein
MPKQMNFIVSENSFEKFGMMVILGTTGAAMETQMNFFFTFWGLFLLKKKYNPKVAGVPWYPIKKMAAAAFKKMLKGFGYEDMWDMVKDGVEEGKIRLIPCGMTMELMRIKQESLHPFVEKPVGAAAFLEMCDNADAVISL